MVSRENPYLEQFEDSLEDWLDERFLSRQDLRALAMFSVYLVNLAEDDGWQYDGHSFKVDGEWCCLVVKSTREGIPQVVFTSAPTHTGCVRHFIKKLESGGLQWRDDRYRQ